MPQNSLFIIKSLIIFFQWFLLKNWVMACQQSQTNLNSITEISLKILIKMAFIVIL